MPAPEYHNPDPLVRLIGPANEGKVKIEGVETTALIDTGACMSAITKSFTEALELDLKPLDAMLDIEGTGGGKVPYHGYVECRLTLIALIDTGACMSAITKSFAEALELDLKPLDAMLDIEGTGGGKVPYHGYVECRLTLPQIKKFDQDVLMLVIDDSQYGARVPIQIGTLHIDMAIDLDTDEEKAQFKRRWERAEMATYLRICLHAN